MQWLVYLWDFLPVPVNLYHLPDVLLFSELVFCSLCFFLDKFNIPLVFYFCFSTPVLFIGFLFGTECVGYRLFHYIFIYLILFVIDNYSFSFCFCVFAEFTDDSLTAEIDLNKV